MRGFGSESPPILAGGRVFTRRGLGIKPFLSRELRQKEREESLMRQADNHGIRKGGDVMHTEIGETAGEIWRALNAKGPLSLSGLTNELRREEKRLLMGLGWLLREDKIKIEQRQRKGWIISLK